MAVKFENGKNYVFSFEEYRKLDYKTIPAWVSPLDNKEVFPISERVGFVGCGGAAMCRAVYPEWCIEVE